MFKKLQNLLFEEEEIEEIEEEPAEEVPAPAPRRRRETQEVQTRPEPKTEEQHTSMQRIDVTQPLQKITDAIEKEQGSVFAGEEAEKPKGLGLTIDEVDGSAQRPQVQPEQPKRPAAPVSSAKPARKKPAYDFSPVISPFFGVDEKDPNVVHTTGSAGKNAKGEDNTPKVISPIYGAVKDREEPVSAFVPPAPEKPAASPKAKVPELPEESDDVPEFSLDDILKVRDEEYSRENRMIMQSLFPDLDDAEENVPDETTVLDSRNITPYGTFGRKQ